MVSIFTTAKDFINEFKIIQNNSFNSWRALSNRIEIIIIGDSSGVSVAAKSIQAIHIKEVEKTVNGTPTLSGLFHVAQKIAKNEILCFVNADIIFHHNFINVISSLKDFNKNFLAVGYRWDFDVNDRIQFFDNESNNKFWSTAKQKSKRHACTGIDYFIFKRGSFKNVPKLAIGRFGWDNWLLWNARRRRIPLIDVSNDLYAIHQNHSYKFGQFREKSDIMKGAEGQVNSDLIKDKTLNLLDANYYMMNGEIKKNTSKAFKNRNLGKLPLIFPECIYFLNIYKRLYRRFFL